MDETTQNQEVVEQPVEEKTEPVLQGYTPEQFAKEYQELCRTSGFQIVVNPVYIARDDGTFSTQLQTSVGKMPKQEK